VRFAVKLCEQAKYDPGFSGQRGRKDFLGAIFGICRIGYTSQWEGADRALVKDDQKRKRFKGNVPRAQSGLTLAVAVHGNGLPLGIVRARTKQRRMNRRGNPSSHHDGKMRSLWRFPCGCGIVP
jgi:hypothetical protein